MGKTERMTIHKFRKYIMIVDVGEKFSGVFISNECLMPGCHLCLVAYSKEIRHEFRLPSNSWHAPIRATEVKESWAREIFPPKISWKFFGSAKKDFNNFLRSIDKKPELTVVLVKD